MPIIAGMPNISIIERPCSKLLYIYLTPICYKKQNPQSDESRRMLANHINTNGPAYSAHSLIQPTSAQQAEIGLTAFNSLTGVLVFIGILFFYPLIYYGILSVFVCLSSVLCGLSFVIIFCSEYSILIISE